MNKSKELHFKLERVKKIGDLNLLLSQDQNSQEIKKYFYANRIPYQLFHSFRGFEHCGISKDGKFKYEDFVEGLKEINGYIKAKRAKKVLELASGRGPNSYFLAKANPKIEFDCLDLLTNFLRRYRLQKNMHFHEGDYHNLSLFSDKSYDVIFIIEALCYSKDKELFLKQVHKKLKKGGILFILDAYRGRDNNILSNEEKKAVCLVEKGMGLNEFETLDHFEKTIKNFSGFKLIEREDLSPYVIPTLKRFELLAKFYLLFPPITRIVHPLFPISFTKNLYAGYFLPFVMESHITVYFKHVLEKK